jgi:hypothetical protein
METTEKVTHTPIPWTVERIDYEPCHPDEKARDVSFEVKGPSGLVVQTIMREIGREDQRIATDEANVRLIAAAPEMLAVLRGLEWIGMNDGCGVSHLKCPACSALQSRGTGHNHFCGLAAAIAKAQGDPTDV